MKPIKTLVLYSRGAPILKRILADTTLRGIFNMPYSTLAPSLLNNLGWVGQKLSNMICDPYAALGYVNDWRDSFNLSTQLDIIECNINDLVAYRKIKNYIKEIPLIVVLHSSAGDNLDLLLATSHWFQDRVGKLAVFLGNEYDMMEEKRDFLNQVGADYICTQLPINAANFMYGDVESSTIIEMPHALNPSVYKPVVQREARKFKIGFIGARYPSWIGDSERNDFIDYCNSIFPASENFISIGEGNISRGQWADFLNNCQGTIGAEAGSYFLDRNGLILSRAKMACSQYNLKTENIFDCKDMLEGIQYTSGKAISSRHFEPMGTKTAQILLEGEYNGILKPDIHYFAVKSDLSNLKEKVAEFNDLSRQNEVANIAFDYVMDCHTYGRRITKFIKTIFD